MTRFVVAVFGTYRADRRSYATRAEAKKACARHQKRRPGMAFSVRSLKAAHA